MQILVNEQPAITARPLTLAGATQQFKPNAAQQANQAARLIPGERS